MTFDKSDVITPKNSIYRYVAIASSIAAVFLVMFMIFRWIYVYDEIYGYICMDINPSVEFAIDENYIVIKAEPINDDGIQLIDDMEVKGRPVKDIMFEMLKRCEDKGFIDKKDERIILVSAAVEDSGEDKNKIYSERGMDDFLNGLGKEIDNFEGGVFSVKTVRSNFEERQLSSKYKTSMGKYHLFLKAKESGVRIKPEELNGMTVRELIEKLDVKKDNEKLQNSSSEPEPKVTKKPEKPLRPSETPMATIRPTDSPKALPTVTPSAELKPIQNKNQVPEKVTEPPVKDATVKVPEKTPIVSGVQKGKGELKIQHLSDDKNINTKGIHYNFIVVNTGNKAIDMKDVKVRYYLKEDEKTELRFAVYYYGLGDEKKDVNGKFHNLKGRSKANKFLEITFDTGILEPGKSVYVLGEIISEDWRDFNQQDDYSFKAKGQSYEDWDRITAYVSDNLVWGIEPD